MTPASTSTSSIPKTLDRPRRDGSATPQPQSSQVNYTAQTLSSHSPLQPPHEPALTRALDELRASDFHPQHVYLAGTAIDRHLDLQPPNFPQFPRMLL